MKGAYLVEVVPTIPNDLVSVKAGAKIAMKTERTIWRDIRSGQAAGLGHTPVLSDIGFGFVGSGRRSGRKP